MVDWFVSRLQPRHTPLARRSWILLAVSTLVYLGLFLGTYGTLDRQAVLFAYVYISLVAWLYGTGRALFAVLLALVACGSRLGADPDPRAVVGSFLFLVDALAVGAVSRLYVRLKDTEEKLREEHEKSEMILRNIFPKRIAERLKEGEVLIADRYLETTLLFSDLVGFTELTRTLPPQALVSLLDRLITGFDRLSERMGLEKIKTIGDAYLVASGMPDENADHAASICRMALAMQEFVRDFNRAEDLQLHVRIGIHSGPVIGGVIGPKKFTFDLWGDTVNMASRLETTGVPDRIQVSQSTWERTRHLFRYEARPVVDVKGYGEVRTWFLLGALDDPGAAPESAGRL